MTNLIEANWQDLDSVELRLLLRMRIGSGQYNRHQRKSQSFYLPQFGPACKLTLTYKNKKIVAVEPGPAFDAAEWSSIRAEIERSLLAGKSIVGREYSFSAFRVTRWWRGARSGVQIVPPPEDAPRANVELADHPFILEFPIKESDLSEITNHRRIHLHRRLTLLLNVLLKGHTTFHLPRARSFWGTDVEHGFKSKWLQEFFVAKLGAPVTDSFSEISGERIEELQAEDYYEDIAHDGGGLRVPSDLDESICRYLELDLVNRTKFDRAAFWLEMAARQGAISSSSALACLAFAAESLIERGVTHQVHCDRCKKDCQHDSPSVMENFRNFFEKYAPGIGHKKQRDDMYALRSGIVHGNDLMRADQDYSMGWDPPSAREEELSRELWGIVRIAMRNWLRDPPSFSLARPAKTQICSAETPWKRILWTTVGVLLGSAAMMWLTRRLRRPT